MNFKEELKKLRDLRRAKSDAEGRTDKLLAEVREIEIYKKYCASIEERKRTRDAAKEQEGKIKAAAEAKFDEDKAKDITPGALWVERRAGVEIVDRDEFFTWACKEARHLLEVNEKDILALLRKSSVPGAKMVKTPFAKIAAGDKLSDALDKLDKPF